MVEKKIGFRSHMFSMRETKLSLHCNLITCVIFSVGAPSKVANDSKEVEGSIISIKPDVPHRVTVGSDGAYILYLDGIDYQLANLDYQRLSEQWKHIPKAMRDGDHSAVTEFRNFIGKDNYCYSPQMVEIIERLYCSPFPRMTQTELAATLGMERTQALRFFKSVTGQTFRKFKKWTALITASHAAQLGQPIGSAAIDAGFSDAAHVTRTAGQVFGLTPSSALNALASLTTLHAS